MSLRRRLEEIGSDAGTVVRAPVLPVPEAAASTASVSYQGIAGELHRRLIDRIDLEVMASMAPERVREELRRVGERIIDESGYALNANERRRLIGDIEHEVLGLGPLEPLLADHSISDILVNGPHQVWVERAGRLELTGTTFTDDAHLLKIIDRIVSRVGRRVDESSPMVDARLPDGSRVNAIIPPLAIDGPSLSIRRFGGKPLAMHDLLEKNSIARPMAELLTAMVKARLSILISGGTGSGKTTMLNVLSGYIPAGERVVTIEDAAELQLQQKHVVRLETRPPNLEGKGEVTQRALVRNALRMRPDRIILGEVRGAEAFDMLQAMNTGHEGSMATLHANTPRDATVRLENMLGMAGLAVPPKALRQQIVSAVQVVVQVSRFSDGRRRVASICELVGIEGEIITMQEIFRFEQTGVSADGTVLGEFRATGVKPRCTDRLRVRGLAPADTIYDPARPCA